MDVTLAAVAGLFFLLLASSLVAFRFGLQWVYIYAAASAGALYVLDFLQVHVFGQLLFVSEVFFAANFLLTDIIEEHYGKKAARKVIPIVIGSFLLIWILTYVASLVTPAESDTFYGPLTGLVGAYTPLAMFLIVTIYSLLQYIDTGLYDFIRRKTGGRWLWMRNNGATLITQTVDVFLSYGILIRVLFPELSWDEIGSAMLVAAAFKYSMAFIDTPFVYLSYYFKPQELKGAGKALPV